MYTAGKFDRMNSTKPWTHRPAFASGIFYVALIVLAGVMAQFTNYINEKPYFLPSVTDPAALSKAQDAYAAVNNLLTTLSTGLLAALGLFLTSRPKKRYPSRDVWLAVTSAVCVCISLYWGYVSAQNVEWAIESSISTLDIAKIQWPRQLQFYAMVLGVFFFADFLRRDLSKVERA